MSSKEIKAIEYNDGSISVFYLEDNTPTWGAHYYSLDAKQAAADYKLLLEGADPVADNWEYGEYDDLDQVKACYQYGIIEHWEDEFNGGFAVIAHDGYTWPERCGCSGEHFMEGLGAQHSN